MRPLLSVLAALGATALISQAAYADAPSRVRELTCSDGTVFTGEQVRFGAGTPPRTFRNVVPGDHPAAFNFHASRVTAPDGTLVEAATWDHSQGLETHRTLITCSFIIPVGPFTDHLAEFDGFFVP